MKTLATSNMRRTVAIVLMFGLLIPNPSLMTQRAIASTSVGYDGIDECGNRPAGCRDCECPPEGETADGAMPPTETYNPIDFLQCSAVERSVDLYLPGPYADWSHVRTYDSRMSRVSGTVVGPEGAQWHGGAAGPYIRPNIHLANSYELYFDASSKRLLTHDSATDTYLGTADSPLTMVITGEGTSAETFTVTNTETGDVLVFYGMTHTTNSGRLEKRTTRALLAANKPGYTYNYTHFGEGYWGLVDWVMTPQDWKIQYEYEGTIKPLLKSISVYDGDDVETDTLLQYAEYTYYENLVDSMGQPLDNSSLGSTGDLVQVEVRRRASHDSGNDPSDLTIRRFTQYRYYPGGAGSADQHKIKMVFESDAIQRAIEYGSLSSPEELLALDDSGMNGTINGVDLQDFASRSYMHHQDANAPESTAWYPNSAEPLSSKYGGYHNTYLQHDGTQAFWGGAVASEKVNGACSACNSGAVGFHKDYYYLELYGWYGFKIGKDEPNRVVYIVVEDTVDATGAPRYRRLYGINYNGTAIREALIEDPRSPSEHNIWCTSLKFGEVGSPDGDDWRVVERRMPSAHKGLVTNDEQLKRFLDPVTVETGQTEDNDTRTVHSDSGLVYHYEYGNTVGKRPTGMLVSEGTGTTKYYISATDYDDGDKDNQGVDEDEQKLPVARYTYPEKKGTTERADGIKTELSYTFWDDTAGTGEPTDTAIKAITTTLPIVPTTQNGAGGTHGTDNIETYQYFDKLGRLRWTKDGEGYVNYYSYHPDTGVLAYTAVDVDPSSAPTGATGNDTKWLSWNDDGDGDSTYESTAKPSSRDSSLPTALALVTQREFDDQGRKILTTEQPSGDQHATRYFANGTVEFPYINGSGVPALPARVTKVNDGDQLLETYTVDPSTVSTTSTTSLPSNTADYVTLTKYDYHAVNGQLERVDRYHNIDGSGGEGTGASDEFYGTRYLYDALGRRGATVQYVEDGQFQVTVDLFDVRDRVTETRRGVVDTAPTSYSTLAGSSPATGYATVSKTFYDKADETTPLKVGDDHVTQIKQINTVDGSANPVKYTFVDYHRTFRGHLRGVERRHHDGSSTADVTPYNAMDVDWLGRTVATAQYTSEPAWSTLKGGYDAWVNHTSGSTGRNDLTVTHYDDLGRVYRTDRYPGTEGTKHFEINNYYDRNHRLVCTGDKYAAHTEYAYDGAGRQYQMRTVSDVEATKYTGGTFNYRDPLPDPHWKAGTSGLDTSQVRSSVGGFNYMTSGDDGVIEFTHMVYDSSGNVVQEHSFEMNHDDTDGLDLTANDDYVRRSVYSWYDEDRVATMADYGSGDTASGAGAWKYASVLSRSGTAPTASSASVLVTQYSYNPDTGRQETVTDPAGIDAKTFYDDLGRRTAVAENYVNFSPPSTGIGGGTNDEQDRVTAWAYHGLGQVTALTAYNGSSEKQITLYQYTDDYDASLVTASYYPDAVNSTVNPPTIPDSDDGVRVAYHLDGSLKTRTDQRQVVMTYVYDNARRLIREGATTIPSGVYGGGSETDAVKSIARTYDSLGRPVLISSYPNATGTGTPLNEIKYTYHWLNRVNHIYQEHDGAVDGSTPSVQYDYDTEVDSNVYINALRRKPVDYPVASGAKLTPYFGTNDSIADRLNRPVYEKLFGGTPLNGNADHTTYYQYNGTARLAGLYTHAADTNVERKMYSATGNYDSFDRFGRPLKFAWKDRSSGAVRDQVDYSYDYAGNRLTRNVRVDLINGTYPDERDQDYEYDGLHRLVDTDQGDASDITGLVADPLFEQRWTLDQLGNWPEFKQDGDGDGAFTNQFDLDQDRAHNAANETGQISGVVGASNWVDPQHDAAGNMTTMPRPSDPFAQGLKLKYDAWNRLAEVRTLTDYLLGAYAYDGLGQRIKKNTGGSTNHRDYYYNDQWQLLTEVKDGNVLAIYHWHPYYIDALAVRMRYQDTHFFLQDANYNVTAAVDDTGNAVVERYSYRPYGHRVILDENFSLGGGNGTISAIDNNHLYTGRERDPVTGLQLNRHRYYIPPLGRWVNRDPIEYEGSPWNLYEYVSGNPNTRFDPYGDVAWWAPCAATAGGCLVCLGPGAWACRNADDFADCFSYYWSILPGWHKWACGGICAGTITCLKRPPKPPTPPKPHKLWGPHICRPGQPRPGWDDVIIVH